MSLTSPPYMNKFDHAQNPFTNYSTKGNGYEAYLEDLQKIYRQIVALMKPEAKIIVEVSNVKTKEGVTPLAWDVGETLSSILKFEGETVICWDNYGLGYDHSYCLIFSDL